MLCSHSITIKKIGHGNCRVRQFVLTWRPSWISPWKWAAPWWFLLVYEAQEYFLSSCQIWCFFHKSAQFSPYLTQIYSAISKLNCSYDIHVHVDVHIIPCFLHCGLVRLPIYYFVLHFQYLIVSLFAHKPCAMPF